MSVAVVTVRSVNSRRLLARLARGDLRNVAFNDVCRLLSDLGFVRLRIRGSHRVFGHPEVAELINLQDVGGQAKPYQLRQVMRLVERYDLELEDE